MGDESLTDALKELAAMVRDRDAVIDQRPTTLLGPGYILKDKAVARTLAAVP